MRRTWALSLAAAVAVAQAEPPPPAAALPLPALAAGTTRVTGDFSAGRPMPDLSWAWNSANACFVSLQARKFSGPHVLFTGELPARSELTITVSPDDPAQDVSLYAYSVSDREPALPPDLPRSLTCEAEYKWDRPWKGRTQDHTRAVSLTGRAVPVSLVVGVSGPVAVKGGFTLTFTLPAEPRPGQ